MGLLKSIGRHVLREAPKMIKEQLDKLEWKRVLDADSIALTHDNAFDCKLGDFVRFGDYYCMVIKSKTALSDGCLLLLDMPLLQWHYQLSYCPYSKTMSEDGGCGIETAAISRSDGRLNSRIVAQFYYDIEHKEHDPWNCPPNRIYFPAFDRLNELGKDWYIPAIEELYDTLKEKSVQSRLFQLLHKVNKNSIEFPLYFWSSTDNGCTPNRRTFESDALALLVSENGTIMSQSLLKNESHYTLYFHNI